MKEQDTVDPGQYQRDPLVKGLASRQPTGLPVIALRRIEPSLKRPARAWGRRIPASLTVQPLWAPDQAALSETGFRFEASNPSLPAVLGPQASSLGFASGSRVKKGVPSCVPLEWGSLKTALGRQGFSERPGASRSRYSPGFQGSRDPEGREELNTLGCKFCCRLPRPCLRGIRDRWAEGRLG